MLCKVSSCTRTCANFNKVSSSYHTLFKYALRFSQCSEDSNLSKLGPVPILWPQKGFKVQQNVQNCS